MFSRFKFAQYCYFSQVDAQRSNLTIVRNIYSYFVHYGRTINVKILKAELHIGKFTLTEKVIIFSITNTGLSLTKLTQISEKKLTYKV